MGSGYLKKKKQSKMMQQQFSQMQERLSEELDQVEVTGSAPNDLVRITLKGSHEMTNIEINPECVDPEDIDGLEVLIKAAYQNALEQLKEKTESPEALSGLGSLGSLFGGF